MPEAPVPEAPQAPEARGSGKLEGLTGLRGILCLCVVIAHTVGHLAPRSTAPVHLGLLAQAVVVFFTLSGFLIFLPFCRALLDGDRLPDGRRYLAHRITRVYPAYVVVFLVADLGMGAVFTRNAVLASVPRTDAGTGRITDPGTTALHLSLLQTFVPARLQTGLNVAWSLTTELGFYLLVPVLAVAVAAATRRRRRDPVPAIAGVLAVLAAAALVAKTAIAVHDARSAENLESITFGPHGWGVLAESTLALADVFVAGMAAVLIFLLIGRGALPRWSGRRWRRSCAVVVACSGAASLVALKAQSVFASTFLAILAGTVLLLVTEPVARGRRSALGRVLDAGPLEAIGEVSLSLYLWHFPVIVLVSRWHWYGADTLPGAAWSVLLVTTISLALAVTTYLLVERPAMALRRDPNRSRPARPADPRP